MNKTEALSLISAVIADLEKEDLLDGPVAFSDNLPLLGPNSPLDSLSFISFLTELEDRITSLKKQETYIVLNDISEFDVNSNRLTAIQLASHLTKLMGK
jgi:hypothetical protein